MLSTDDSFVVWTRARHFIFFFFFANWLVRQLYIVSLIWGLFLRATPFTLDRLAVYHVKRKNFAFDTPALAVYSLTMRGSYKKWMFAFKVDPKKKKKMKGLTWHANLSSPKRKKKAKADASAAHRWLRPFDTFIWQHSSFVLDLAIKTAPRDDFSSR